MSEIKAKPFLKWVGGKGQLLQAFETLLPRRLAEIDGFTYIEPFIGGGAMLFFMLQKFGNIKKAVINDTYTVNAKDESSIPLERHKKPKTDDEDTIKWTYN